MVETTLQQYVHLEATETTEGSRMTTDKDIDDMRTGKEDTIRETTGTAADHRVDPAAGADHPENHKENLEGAPHHYTSTPLP